MKRYQWDKFFLTITLSVCIIVPLANDIFISGAPEIKNFFVNADTSLIFCFSLLGLAVAQPFYGPLSDRFGRKPVLIAGLLLFTLSSILIVATNVFSILLMGRFFQAFGACSAIASALPIARDTCDKNELMHATSLIMAIMGIGPVLGPLIGSILNGIWGWRASFIFLVFLGCFYLTWVWILFKETHCNKNMEALRLNKIYHNYLNLLKKPHFLRHCFINGFSYGILFSYINLSPFFIIEKMNFSLFAFGFIVAVNAIAIIIMSIITPRIAQKITLPYTMQLGFFVILSSGLLMWLLTLIFSENIYTFMLPVFVTTVGIGIIRTSAGAGAMQLVQSNVAGSAAAIFNSFAFSFGFVAIILTSMLVKSTKEFSLFIAITAIVALITDKLFVRFFQS